VEVMVGPPEWMEGGVGAGVGVGGGGVVTGGKLVVGGEGAGEVIVALGSE
jgi:hypothetical protein